MLESQIEQEERRRVLDNDRRVRDQSSTFHAHAIADAEIPRGRFATHERSTVIGSSPTSDYPAGPAWCADPGSQLLEPPLGFDNPALEPSMAASPTEGQGDAVVAPSTNVSPGLMSERAAPPLSYGDPARAHFPSPPGTSRDVAGSPPTYRRF